MDYLIHVGAFVKGKDNYAPRVMWYKDGSCQGKPAEFGYKHQTDIPYDFWRQVLDCVSSYRARKGYAEDAGKREEEAEKKLHEVHQTMSEKAKKFLGDDVD